MAVFRIEKTRDYTVMSNYHLRDRSLSLKAKGLLSLMLSLPEDWDYTMKGLARICKDGIDSSSGGIRELEAHGYLVRARVRGANGQLGSIEYTILEQPKEPAQTPAPVREKPIRENPVQANPMLDAPIQENHAQLNKEESSNYPSRTDLSNTKISSPIPSSPPAPRERIGQDGMRKRESYRALILENIEYDVLSQNVQLDKDHLDELVELMVDTVCSNREMIRIAGDGKSYDIIAEQLILPTSELPSHLMMHNYLRGLGRDNRVVLHTHPTDLIGMTHCKPFLDSDVITRTLWSMIPECRIIVPKGVGIVPYEIPGTLDLARATIKQLEKHDVVFWEKHGILAVGEDLIECFDAIDTLSKSAQIYFSARMAGYEPAGMTDKQLDDLVPAFGL